MSFLGIRRPSLLWATKIFHIGIYCVGKLLFSRTRVEVRGIKHIRRLKGNALFAPNHANEIDTVVLCLALDKARGLFGRLPLVFLSREKEFYSDMGFIKAMLYGGVLFRLLGAYPVTPQKERVTAQLRQNTIATHISFLEDGYSVLIYPEGTRTQTGELLPPKSGVAILSEQANRPIVPIAINGTYDLSFADFLFGRKRVSVTFGEPISPMPHMTEHLSFFENGLLYQTKADFVMSRIKEMLSRMRKENK